MKAFKEGVAFKMFWGARYTWGDLLLYIVICGLAWSLDGWRYAATVACVCAYSVLSYQRGLNDAREIWQRHYNQLRQSLHEYNNRNASEVTYL